MRLHLLHPLALLLATGLTTGHAHADTLTGRVVNSVGTGIVGVKLTLLNGFIPLNPYSGTNGVFAILVPGGTYDIGFEPPTSSGLAPIIIRGVIVSVFTNMGTVTLGPGFTLSATVLDANGQPVVNADIDVRDQVSRSELFTPGDNTDSAGNVQVVVPPGAYRIDFKPEPSALIAPDWIDGVIVSSATTVGTITLQPGHLVTGRVVDSQTSSPLALIDLDVDDARSLRRILTPRDNTDSSGMFSLVLAVGLYHFSYDPPQGMNYVGREQFNVQVSGTTNLGTIALRPGVTLSGRVLDPGGVPITGTDIDIDAAIGGARVYTPHDTTNSTGDFSVVVPVGSYRVIAEPLPGSLLVGVRTAAISVTGNTLVPPIILQTGVILSGTVTGYNGAAEAGVDIDVIDPTTGEELVTPRDDTDSFGQYSVVVPIGTWNIEFQPSKGSPSQVDEQSGVTVGGPTVLNQTLKLVPIWGFLATVGVPTVPQQSAVPALLAFVNTTPVARPTRISIVMIDPLGIESLILGPLSLTMPPGAYGIAVIPIFMPPANPALLGGVFRVELRFDDPVSGKEQDHDNFKVVIE